MIQEFHLLDVTICAKTTVTCLKNIQVAPVHEKLTVTVPKGKEAGILGAFPCAIQIGSLIFKVPPQLEEVRPNFRTPLEEVFIRSAGKKRASSGLKADT